MVKGKSQVVVQVDSHEGKIASYCAGTIAQCASSLAIRASSLAPLYKLPFVRGPSPSRTIALWPESIAVEQNHPLYETMT